MRGNAHGGRRIVRDREHRPSSEEVTHTHTHTHAHTHGKRSCTVPVAALGESCVRRIDRRRRQSISQTQRPSWPTGRCDLRSWDEDKQNKVEESKVKKSEVTFYEGGSQVEFKLIQCEIRLYDVESRCVKMFMSQCTCESPHWE